jgi:uncharacterized protein (TIGR02453 family)
MPARTAYFSPALFAFLRELAAHNDRNWFQAHQPRFDADVKAPLLRFIGDFGAGLKKISPHFLADPRPLGGSMFRIYRDTRFSKDKTPYKTHVSAHYRHREGSRDVHAPGFYMHLEPGRSMGGGGLWHPDAVALKRVRDRIVGRSREWRAVLDKRLTIEGESLKRPPAGYDAAHPFVDDLRRKDFYTLAHFSEKQVCAPDFMDRYLEACRKASPLVAFLTKAVGLKW